MTDKLVSCPRGVGSNYFTIIHDRTRSKVYNLNYFLEKFNPDNYFIYKSTNKIKQVSIEDFLEFKFAGYIFFRRELYKNTQIDIWIDWLNYYNDRVQYLSRPTPPFSPEKIIIRK